MGGENLYYQQCIFIHDMLDSLVSGVPVANSICESVLSIEENDKDLIRNFMKHLREEESCESFSDPIIKFAMKNLLDSFIKTKISKNGKQSEIHMQRIF